MAGDRIAGGKERWDAFCTTPILHDSIPPDFFAFQPPLLRMGVMDFYRRLFPITEDACFLNHAAVSPLSRRSVEAVQALLEEASRRGIACYPRWIKRIGEVRALLARLIHAQTDEVAFVGNTSEGLGIVASGLSWGRGDHVLVTHPDFPSNLYPWMNLERRGVHVGFVERRHGRFDTGDVERALCPRTRLLAVSSADFLTGYLCGLQALGDLCRRKGILLCVDGIQSVGVVPLDVKACGIHFLAAGGHKWLLGPMGCGMLFVDRSVGSSLQPVRVGWKSVKHEEDFFNLTLDLKSDAGRFEPGTMNVQGIYALGAAVELLLEVGIDQVRQAILRTQDLFIEALKGRHLKIVSPIGAEERSGILTFAPSGDPGGLFRHFLGHQVMVSERKGMIRLSPHFYNNENDVKRFFQVMDRF